MKYAAFLLIASAAFAQAPAANSSSVLAVTGDVPMPLSLTLANLAAMPRQTIRVPNPDGSMAAYEGVALIDVLKRAGVPFGGELRGKALASYVLAKASDGYQVVFTPGEIDPSFGNQIILIADHRDGAPLAGNGTTEPVAAGSSKASGPGAGRSGPVPPPGNQGSLRLMVANDKEGARSVRMLETLEFIRLRK